MGSNLDVQFVLFLSPHPSALLSHGLVEDRPAATLSALQLCRVAIALFSAWCEDRPNRMISKSNQFQVCSLSTDLPCILLSRPFIESSK